MTDPFESRSGIDESSSPRATSKSSSRSAQQADGGLGQDKSDADAADNVVFLHPAANKASPGPHYLDPSVDLESLPIPLARFPGIKRVLPDREFVCIGWSKFVDEVAPQPALVVPSKDQVPYYIAGTLKEAELINSKIREKLLKKGQSTIGKQRSGAHIDTLGPALFLDDDGDVFSRETALRALGASGIIYSTYSFGIKKADATEPSRGGRIAVFLNRPVTPAEYCFIWDGINHLLGGGLDEHGRSPSLCYGRHSRRSDQAPYRRIVIEGAALDADSLAELGRSLKPQSKGTAQRRPTGANRKPGLSAEIERAKLMGAVRPSDDYSEWAAGAAAFKRAHPDDTAVAFRCFDVWSSCSSKYKGTEATRCKFDEVPADYDGTAAPLMLDMLHWRARRRAETVLGALYSPTAHWQKSSAFDDLSPESLADVTFRPKGAESIEPGSLKPKDGILALEYLSYCWRGIVYEQIIAGFSIPQAVLDEVKEPDDQRRLEIDVADRCLHIWGGKDLAADTAALADAIIAADPQLYRIDQTLVRLSKPASDPATAARVRKIYRYEKSPGEAGDPALHTGERLAPLLPSDTEALREIIAEHVATKRRINDGTKKEPIWREEIASFPFKPGTALHVGPDAGILKDLGKRALVERVPEIVGVVTAPVMPELPPSTKSSDLIQPGADRLITRPGFDVASGLYLAPIGSAFDVPETPSAADVETAANLLQEPWADFPFVSPGDDISPGVSRSAALYAMMIAPNRRALKIAPGIAFNSHGEGMSNGKTLCGEVICTIATGEIPTAMNLSSDFAEQKKEIISHLVEGDGCLFLDNIANGTRFDSVSLASAMTNPRFKARLLGTNKLIEASTNVMVVANGNAINLAGDLASRFMLSSLNSGLERPEDRSVTVYKIQNLREWVVEHRQQLVAAVHTIVRGYLQACRVAGGTPSHVAARREVGGNRFGGPCDVLRDAFLWAFPDLPDPFLSFKASAAHSSTKAESALVLTVLDRVMVREAAFRFTPAWAVTTPAVPKPRERLRWEQSFRARWNRMTPDQRQRRYRTAVLNEAERQIWERILNLARLRLGRSALRAGRIRLTSSEIKKVLQLEPDDCATVEGAMHGKGLNSVSLGRWLKDRLVEAPINGLVLRSATGRENSAEFWITNGS